MPGKKGVLPPILSYMRKPASFYKQSLAIAVPIMLQYMITFSLGFVDTVMVSLIGMEEMSAVALADMPVFVIQLIIFGVQSGAAVLISQHWGKQDLAGIDRILGVSLYISCGIVSVIAAVLYFFPTQVLFLTTDNASLVPIAEPYLKLIGAASLFDCAASMYIGLKRSTGNARFGMLVILTAAISNVAGNYIFIFGHFGAPELGVEGAALATVLSRILECSICVVSAASERQTLIQLRRVLMPGKESWGRFAAFAAPVMLNETMWGVGTALYTVIMGHMPMSTELLSAYTIAGGINKMCTVSLYGLSGAASVIIGREVVSNTRERVLETAKVLGTAALGIGLFTSLLLQALLWLVFKPFGFRALNLTPDAAALCSLMLCGFSFNAPFRSYETTAVIGTVRAGGDSRAAMLIDVLPLWLLTLPLMTVLGLLCETPPMFWFCFILTNESLPKAPLGYLRVKSGKWIRDLTHPAAEAPRTKV